MVIANGGGEQDYSKGAAFGAKRAVNALRWRSFFLILTDGGMIIGGQKAKPDVQIFYLVMDEIAIAPVKLRAS